MIPNQNGDNDGKNAPEMAPTKGALVSWVVDRVKHAREVRDTEYGANWEEFTRIWRGIHADKDKTTDSERSRLISPASQQAVEMTASEMEEATFGRTAWFDIADNIADEEKADAISYRDQLLEDFELNNVPEAIADAFLMGCVYGTGIAVINVAVVDEHQFDGPDTKRFRVTVEAVRPDEFFIDAAATHIESALFCGRDVVKPKFGIKEKQAAGIYLKGPVESYSGNVAGSTTGLSTSTDVRNDGVLITEYFGKVPAMLLPGAAVLYMTAHAAQPGAALYYGGIVVVLCYSNCLWRLSYIYSGSISLILLIAYEYVAYFVNPVPFDVFLSNSTFLVSAGLISVFLNLIQEYQLRCSFVDNEQLRIERTRSERLLSRSEAANRAKNDFLAIMSHELRTPLNAIIGFSEIIANQMFGPVGQEKYADYAGDIRSSGTHLLSIINDILDISKAEAGKLSLEEEPIDPVEELNRSMHMFRQRTSEIGVELSFRVRDDIPWIIADPRLFNQVAINLTSNALKFTPEGGRVWIEIGLDAKGNFAMSVKDTGIGIKGKDIQRIFEPFVQVENAMSRTHQGTGLGLPLVRKIMGLHGGSVELESIVGEGTIATATFPKNRFVAPETAGDIKWNVRAS